jgi:hypothetical protein
LHCWRWNHEGLQLFGCPQTPFRGVDIAKNEEVLIKRRSGETFSLVLKKSTQSPFDIPGITTKATTEDILAAVRNSRSR